MLGHSWQAVTACAKQGQLYVSPRWGELCLFTRSPTRLWEPHNQAGLRIRTICDASSKERNKSLPGRLSCGWHGSWIHSPTYSRQAQLEGCAQKLGITWESHNGHPSSDSAQAALLLVHSLLTSDLFWYWTKFDLHLHCLSGTGCLGAWAPFSVSLALADIKYKTIVLTTDIGVLTSAGHCAEYVPCVLYNSQHNKNDT